MRTSDFAAVVSLLNVCVIVLAMAGSVDAVEIAIVGAGFEEHGGVEGEFGSGHPHEASRISSLYGVQKWLNGNYNEAVFPKVWEADWDTRYQSIHWPDDQSGDPWDPAEGPDVAGFPPAANNPDGGAFEGDKTFRAMAYDGVENIHEFFGSYGIYQILDEPVKANHLYTLSVAVGTGAEYATRTVAPDHGLELVAGGMTVNPEVYDPSGEVVLATVRNRAVPAGTWRVETLRFNSVGVDPALLTKKLQIRIFTNSGGDVENPETDLYGHHVEYDDVRLTRHIAGDANQDDDVDVWAFDGSGDAQALSSNLGRMTGARWADGDFNGDGDVDVWAFDGSGDAQLLSSALGWTAGDVGPDAVAGTAEAIYHAATGELFFDIGANVAVVGIAAEGMAHDRVRIDSRFGAPAQNANGALAWFNATGLPTAEDSVGLVLPVGLTVEQIAFSYTPIGGETTQAAVTIVVPEPATITMLLVAGLLCVFRTRRKN